MKFSEYRRHDATALARLVAEGKTTADELLDLATARMAEVAHLGAVPLDYTHVARDHIARGLPDGPFRGVPFLLKDSGAEHPDYPTHSGSRLSKNEVHGYVSEISARMMAAGLVVFGRTAAPEYSVGVATEAAVYGAPTRNPWDPSRTPGGSSGGAGAAVAAGIVPAAQGADGGGSVRIPASCCGLVGFKPSRGLMPEGPVAGEGWGGMATDGFLTRSLRDTAALLDVTAGSDRGAPYAAPALPSSFTAALGTRPPRLKIAVAREGFGGWPVAPEIADALDEAARLLSDLGHHVTDATPDAPHEAMMRAWVDIVACGTALGVKGDLARLGRDLRDDDLEPLAHSAIAHAATLSGSDYLSAISTVHYYGRRMAPFFADHDILLSPTLAELPAKIGRFDHSSDDYVAWRMEKVWPYSPFTAAFNATGQPAVSLPLTWRNGLPVGIHLAAAFGADTGLMSLCAELEEARPWFDRVPD